MKRPYLLLKVVMIIFVLSTVVFGAENTKIPLVAKKGTKAAKVEVTVAPSVKTAIDKATPAANFAYYVVKGTEPKTDTDLVKSTLFVCCDV